MKILYKYEDFRNNFIGCDNKPKRISEVDLYLYIKLVSKKYNINSSDLIKYLICKSLESIYPSKEKSSLILKLDIILRRVLNE